VHAGAFVIESGCMEYQGLRRSFSNPRAWFALKTKISCVHQRLTSMVIIPPAHKYMSASLYEMVDKPREFAIKKVTSKFSMWVVRNAGMFWSGGAEGNGGNGGNGG
jgi:hypothetical protein